MPHYDFRDGKFVEIPIEPSDEKRIAREQGHSRSFTTGFNVGLAFGELFSHPLELPGETDAITLATLYDLARIHGEKTGRGDGFRRAAFGSVVVFASGFSGRDPAIDLSLHEIEDPNHLLAFTYEPDMVRVDNGEVVTLPAGIKDTVETSKLLARVATDFLAPIKGFASMPQVAEVATAHS